MAKRIVVMLEITVGDADENNRGPNYVPVEDRTANSVVIPMLGQIGDKRDFENGTSYAFRLVGVKTVLPAGYKRLKEKDIVYESGEYWVKRASRGFEVYRAGNTYSTRCAVIGFDGEEGMRRVKAEIERRQAADQSTTTKDV